MDLQDQLLAIERRLWTNDAPFYEANLTDEALLVFSETGVITRDAAVAAIRKENADGRQWEHVEFNNGHHVAERARPPRSILEAPDDRNRRSRKLGQIAVSDRGRLTGSITIAITIRVCRL